MDFRAIKAKLENSVYCKKEGRFVNKDTHKDCECKAQ